MSSHASLSPDLERWFFPQGYQLKEGSRQNLLETGSDPGLMVVFIRHLTPGIEFITHTETIASDPSWVEIAGSTLVTSP